MDTWPGDRQPAIPKAARACAAATSGHGTAPPCRNAARLFLKIGTESQRPAHDDESLLREIGGDEAVYGWKPLAALAELFWRQAQEERAA